MFAYETHGVAINQVYQPKNDDYQCLLVVNVTQHERAGDVVVWDLGQRIERRIAASQLASRYVLSDQKAWFRAITDDKSKACWWVLVTQEDTLDGKPKIGFYHETIAKIFRSNARAKVRQFVSNYYLHTFMSHPGCSLNLHGSEPEWILSATTVQTVQNWAASLPVKKEEIAPA